MVIAGSTGEAPLLSLYQMGARDDFPAKLFEKLRSSRASGVDRSDGGNLGWEEPPLTIRRKDGEVHPEYAVAKLGIGFPP